MQSFSKDSNIICTTTKKNCITNNRSAFVIYHCMRWIKKEKETLKISIQATYVHMNIELVHKLNLIFTANIAIQIRVCSLLLWFSCGSNTFSLSGIFNGCFLMDALCVHINIYFCSAFFLISFLVEMPFLNWKDRIVVAHIHVFFAVFTILIHSLRFFNFLHHPWITPSLAPSCLLSFFLFPNLISVALTANTNGSTTVAWTIVKYGM